MARIALGIDPGTALMGYAVVRQDGSELELLACEALVTTNELPLAYRLRYLYDELSRIIEFYHPTEMAVEELFFNRNVRSALAVGQARGVALLAGANRELAVYSYTPLQVKSAISGYGRAGKEQVQDMVRMLLHLVEAPQPDDAADAAAIAVCHLHTTANLQLIQQLTTPCASPPAPRNRPMIAAVHGLLDAVGPDWVVVDVGGVSLRVFVPATAVNQLPPIGGTVRLLTYLLVREDALSLYGFLTQSDLDFFEQVTGVTGVGPRIALAMLSSAPSDALRAAISSENLDSLTRVPGIGRKLASRLILELRGKLTPPDGALTGILGPTDPEVQAALVGLGYAAADAQAAIASLPAGKVLPIEDRIRLSLQYFAKR